MRVGSVQSTGTIKSWHNRPLTLISSEEDVQCRFHGLMQLLNLSLIRVRQQQQLHSQSVFVTERTDFKIWILGTEFIANGDSQEHTGQTTGCRHRDADTNTERLRENPQQHSLHPRRGAGA